jgi:sugar phosphate permease
LQKHATKEKTCGDKPGRAQMRRRWSVLLPIMMMTFLIAFIDRTNIGFAIPSMRIDLQLDSTVIGFASGVLFLGYAVTQALGGWIADRGYTKVLIAFLMVFWGICAIAQGFITNATELVVVRFFLGLAEGGIFPAFLTIVRRWFVDEERARANGLWQLCIPLAAAVNGPLAGYILQNGNWRIMFIIEGIFPLIWVFVWLWGVDESPERAKWMSQNEYAELSRHLASSSDPKGEASVSVLSAILSPTAILLFAALLFWNVGFMGFIIWLPSVLKQHASSLSPLVIGSLSATPFIAAIIALLGLAAISDRTMNRRALAFWPLVTSSVALVVGALTYSDAPFWVAMLLLTIAACGIYGVYPVVWSIVTDCAPVRNTGLVTGVINIGGVLGAFAGPFTVGYARAISDTFASGMIAMAACLFVAAACVYAAGDLVVPGKKDLSLARAAA